MRRAFAWLSPDSLAGRTVLTLLAGLLVFHLGSIWLLERGVRDALADEHAGHVAAHLAAGWRTLSALPTELRPGAASALSFPGFDLGWQATPPQESLANPWEALRARLREALPGPPELRAGLVPGGPAGGALRLADGTWLTFAAPPPHGADAPTHVSLASLSAMALGIVLASLLVVRWITRPLRRLAEAAEEFGRGAAPVPLPEDGPREVRDAARTFNAMQARIHRLVADRTQALAAVSHDLRTPIQRLRLRAGFLEDTEAQQAIDADLDDMEGMVESTLAYLRGETESEALRQVDLAAILRTLCDDAIDRAAPVTYVGPDHLQLRVRPVSVKRALGNLIDNAVTYGGNTLVILESGPNAATVQVKDDGPGIPMEALESVFEPFHRLDASRNRGTGGTGLGLTIARQVVQRHGGLLTLANRPEGGLVATICLPRTGASGCGRDTE